MQIYHDLSVMCLDTLPDTLQIYHDVSAYGWGGRCVVFWSGGVLIHYKIHYRFIMMYLRMDRGGDVLFFGVGEEYIMIYL